MGERAAEDRKVEGSIPSRGIFMIEKYILKKLSPADSFTIMNGICGLFSIFFILEGEKHVSMIFILLAVLADGMDGIMARRYGGYLGRYMDEFSDIVSFLIAPILFVYVVYDVTISPIFLFSSALFLITGMLHLVAYHLGKKNFFIGITTPASAIILVTISYLSFPPYSIIFSMLLLSILMISPLPYPRIEKHFAIIAAIIIIFAMSGIKEFVVILLLSTALYAAAGPFYLKIRDSSRNL